MSGEMDRFNEIRNEIDSIDRRLLKLFSERAQLAIELGEIKDKLEISFYDPEREKEIIELTLSQNEGPLDDKAVIGLFQRIIDESRRVEKFSVLSGKNLISGNKRRESK